MISHSKANLIFVFLLLIIFAFLISVTIKEEKNSQSKICINNNCFTIEVAKTLGERLKGLMFRKYLGKDKGMLFVFDQEGEYPFWMKNTLIPLDIIWINENKEIVFMAKNVSPCKQDKCPKFEPKKNAKYVLEINAGLCDEKGIKIGDSAVFDI